MSELKRSPTRSDADDLVARIALVERNRGCPPLERKKISFTKLGLKCENTLKPYGVDAKRADKSLKYPQLNIGWLDALSYL